jgi:diadenosine tetraphosphate (Ap4A) HIT family hydrolase
MSDGGCMFCDLGALRRGAEVTMENDLCLFADEARAEILPGSAVIVPKAHRPTVFDLSTAEIAATFELLQRARPALDERHRPDGYSIGWNCYAASGQTIPHAHLHVLLRFADEPKAGQGLRWWLKQADNRRPDPRAPGGGDRSFG